MAKKKPVNEQELIARAKQRFNDSYQSFKDGYDEMINDLRFLGGDQWPENIRAQREADGRPCLRINKLPQFVDRVLGDMRQSRPSIKIRPVDSVADDDTAEVMTGVIRNIENQSDAEMVYDSGGEAMVRCGFGAWRVNTEWVDQDTFDQEIRIERILNQFSVLFDQNAKKWDKSDGRFAFIYEDLPRETYDKQFPKGPACPWSGGETSADSWITEKTIRVVEYFEKEMETTKLYKILPAGEMQSKVVKELPEDKNSYTIQRTRDVESEKVIWYRLNGNGIIEGPTELKGKYVPIVPIYGKELAILGKSTYSGVVRHAKDSLRLYNYYRSMDAETIALAPKAPWIMTAKMIGPYKIFWDEANVRNHPYLLYVPDPDAPTAKPERNIPQMANQAILQNVMVADQELHDTTGLQLASMGKKSNEKSGKAIEARAKEGDIGQFAYTSNQMRAIKHTARICIDMIPYVYDTARVQRIVGEDDVAKNVEINKPFDDEKTGEKKVFDLTAGKYDVVASVGPSYQTQRQESQAAMIDFASILDTPQRSVIADQIALNSDWPGADEIADRLKKLLPPGIIEPEEGEEPPQPSEAEQKQQAIQEAMMEMEAETKEVELAIKKAEVTKAEAEAAEAEAKAAIAEAEAVYVAKNGFQPKTTGK